MKQMQTPPERLVMMANQIGKFFASQKSEDPSLGIADHLRKFWDPRMRTAIAAHLRGGGEGLLPDVRLAVENLALEMEQHGGAPSPTWLVTQTKDEGEAKSMTTFDATVGAIPPRVQEYLTGKGSSQRRASTDGWFRRLRSRFHNRGQIT